MPRKISDVFKVSSETLEKEGVYDAFVDIDTPFYIDPHLLEYASTPELRNSYERFRSHFEHIIRLLDSSQRRGDPFYREAYRRLIFRELRFLPLGYATGSSVGSGIGEGLAKRLVETASQIVAAGIKDPVIFELVGLFEEGVGADRVSDMTARIILPDLLSFSERVASNLSLNTAGVTYEEDSYKVPVLPGNRDPYILVPSEVLRHLPVARDWTDIDYVVAHNARLRRRVNEIIGATWKDATKVRKRDLRRLLLNNPVLLSDLIEKYKDKSAQPYDFDRDPDGLVIWYDIAQQFAQEHPLDLPAGHVTPDQLLDTVMRICSHFQRLVAHNGLNELLYSDDGKLRHERFAQLLFFGIADSYCRANDLDLSPEVNAGRGPVDFKVSSGYRARVTVEVKYTSNSHLYKGYTTQLPIYNQAEQTEHSIFLVIQTTESESTIEALEELREDAVEGGERAPELIFVDGRRKPSASKARSRNGSR